MRFAFPVTAAILSAFLLGALSCSPAGAVEVTVGWENVWPGRQDRHLPPSQWLWQADLMQPAACRLVKRNGAEGSIERVGGELKVRKTNAVGELIVVAAPFQLAAGIPARISCDVNVEQGDPDRSHGVVRASYAPETYSQANLEGRLAGYEKSRNTMYGLNEQPAGMYFSKCCHIQGKGGMVYPFIVISGDPSVSTWKNWIAEDVREADRDFASLIRASAERRKQLRKLVVSAADVERLCAASKDHTAKMVTENGVVYLTVDGQKIPPVAYHTDGHHYHDDLSEMTAGQALTSNGVPLTVAWIPGASVPTPEAGPWTADYRYDAKKAADDFREMMRGDTNALYLICFDCNAPRGYVEAKCPNEGWIDENGEPVVGKSGYCWRKRNKLNDLKSVWPWVSMASPTWRSQIKSNIRALVAELKRTGHAKRVVGIHFLGFFDGQFTMRYPDYSACAQAAYQDYLKANPTVSTNYWQYSRQLGTLAQADFARTFKEAMGKDVIAIRWDDAPFVSDFSHGTMNRDPNGIDIVVSQPSYPDRMPAYNDAPYVPWASLMCHNKMHWFELDLRTWWAMASSSLPNAQGSAYSMDPAQWGATYRKLAGEMLATRSGFWFYDMGAGWYAAPEIAADVMDSLKVVRDLAEKTPSPWQSEVAVVIDEEGLLGFEGGPDFSWPNHLYSICERQLRYFASAGVPYDLYLAEDVITDPKILKDKKTIVFIFWRHFDVKRIAAVKALTGRGQTHVFLCESGCLGGAKDATGFDIEYFTRKNREYTQIPEPHFKDCVIGSYEAEMNRGWEAEPSSKDPFFKARGRQVWIKEAPGVIVHSRYADDPSHVGIAERRDRDAHRWYLAVPGGLSPEIFNRIVRESGAYLPVNKTGLMVNMNGDFISIHAVKSGRYDFKLPFPCKVINAKDNRQESVKNGILRLNLTAGETCWFLLNEDR